MKTIILLVIFVFCSKTSVFAQEEFWNDPVFTFPRDPSLDTVLVSFTPGTYAQDTIIVFSGRVDRNEVQKIFCMPLSEETIEDFDNFKIEDFTNLVVLKYFPDPSESELRNWVKEYYGVDSFRDVEFNFMRRLNECT